MHVDTFKKIQSKMGLTNKAMGEKMGVSEQTIDKWRGGSIKIPKIAVKLLSFL